ncbi:MAG: IPT/TIG domain-containing protein, partial [Blastocatellia bacterium]
ELTARITIADNAAAGTRTVTVSNPDTQSGRLTNGFEVGAVEPLPATVTDVSPNNGEQGQSLTVTINGSNFQSGATSSFGAGITVNATNFVSASRLSAAITIAGNAAVGPRIVMVTNPDRQPAQLANGFDVRRIDLPAPSVASVSPANGEQGQSLTVTINGSNFQNVASSNFGAGITVNTTNFVSANSLSAAITIGGNAVVGSRTVTVSNPDGKTAQFENGFEVRRIMPPSVASVNPANGEQGQGLTVTINGSNFQNGATSNFGAGITVNSTNFVSASRLSAAITIAANADLGPRTVTVGNPDNQTAQLANGFDVRPINLPAPSVASVSPANGEQGQGLTVTINGSNFQSGATSSFGAGITVNATNFVSASR